MPGLRSVPCRGMKIVHYLSRMRLEDGGVTRAVLDLCGALVRRGHEVTLLTFEPRDVPKSWTAGEPGCPSVLTVPAPAGPLPRLGGPALARVRAGLEDADVLHLHVVWDTVCLQLGRLARRAGVPYVAATHGFLDDWCMAQSPIRKRLYLALGGRRYLEGAAAVHCTAQAERDQSSRWYPRGRPRVVPLIFDHADYEKLRGPQLARDTFAGALPSDGEPVVLYLSRLHHKKGLELLIEAAARLRDDGVSLTTLVAGLGQEQYVESLHRLVEDRGLSGRVAFLGFVSGADKLSLYQAADLFVLPTSQENWGYVLIEALACATPVITTRGVDIWPELEASGGALIVEPAADAIAAAVAELFGDRPRLAAMGDTGRAWVLRELDTDRVLCGYEKLYEEASTILATT